MDFPLRAVSGLRGSRRPPLGLAIGPKSMRALRFPTSREGPHGLLSTAISSGCCATRATQCDPVSGNGSGTYTGVRILAYLQHTLR